VKAALAAITFRGRALIAVGLGLGVGAGLSGQRDVLRIAVLLVVLPLIAAAFVARTHLRLGARRIVTPARVPVGTTAEVELVLTNLSPIRTGTLLLEDHVPADLGISARRVIERVPPQGLRATRYPIHAERRGYHEVGPLAVTAIDPFGMVRLRRSFTATEGVLVVPWIEELDGTHEADHRATGDAATASLASRGDDDVIPREYQLGDDLRRVHWRATARTGALMVRREERPWTRQATIVIDLTTQHHVGEGPRASLEVALSAAASVALHLLRDGWRVKVTSTDGRTLVPQATGAPGAAAILEALALVDASTQAGAVHPGPDLTIAVLTSRPDSLLQVATTRQHGIALIVDTAAWHDSATTSTDKATDRLRAEGWQAAALTDRAGSIAAAWRTAVGGDSVQNRGFASHPGSVR
jgi:uncharacterized protein (DUF58 family)